jgi:Flp pilus assembly protein TadD
MKDLKNARLAKLSASKLYSRKRFSQATGLLKKAVSLNPQFGTAWLDLAFSEFNEGKVNEARFHAKRAVHLGIVTRGNELIAIIDEKS